jgi:hypothetical protein
MKIISSLRAISLILFLLLTSSLAHDLDNVTISGRVMDQTGGAPSRSFSVDCADADGRDQDNSD